MIDSGPLEVWEGGKGCLASVTNNLAEINLVEHKLGKNDNNTTLNKHFDQTGITRRTLANNLVYCFLPHSWYHLVCTVTSAFGAGSMAGR